MQHRSRLLAQIQASIGHTGGQKGYLICGGSSPNQLIRFCDVQRAKLRVFANRHLPAQHSMMVFTTKCYLTVCVDATSGDSSSSTLASTADTCPVPTSSDPSVADGPAPCPSTWLT